MAQKEETTMEKIISLAKRRGFVFPGSEIYGGLAGAYDYGPFGVLLKENVKRLWWKHFVDNRDDVYGIDAAILMHSKVWEASGHTVSFTDPLVECKICHTRFQADHEDVLNEHEKVHGTKSKDELWTDPRAFNMLVESRLGAVEGEGDSVYLRGEITQGVHVNFKNILNSLHPKLPFGVAQIGKAFRNEISPGNFIFRMREFEQMELQYYIRPDAGKAHECFEYWKEESMRWYYSLGFERSKIRFRQHKKDEMAHYAKDAWDIEYDSPFGGWKEMFGVHHRGDFDLRRHSEYSNEDFSYYDEKNKIRFIPWVIETSGGLDRTILFLLLDAYQEDELGGEKRSYLRLASSIAPVTAAVFPLLRNRPELVAKARKVYDRVKKEAREGRLGKIMWDDNGNIGKRYRRQDEIGTPHCITIDFETLENDTVTIRDRDSGEQERMPENELISKILK